MATPRRRRFGHGRGARLLGAVLMLTRPDALAAELLVVELIGFPVVVEPPAPFEGTPPWRARPEWPIAPGPVGFGCIGVKRLRGILPAGVPEGLPLAARAPGEG